MPRKVTPKLKHAIEATQIQWLDKKEIRKILNGLKLKFPKESIDQIQQSLGLNKKHEDILDEGATKSQVDAALDSVTNPAGQLNYALKNIDIETRRILRSLRPDMRELLERIEKDSDTLYNLTKDIYAEGTKPIMIARGILIRKLTHIYTEATGEDYELDTAAGSGVPRYSQEYLNFMEAFIAINYPYLSHGALMKAINKSLK